MELGDWSTVRGGFNTFMANSSTQNNYSCDEDGETISGDVGLDELMIFIQWQQYP